VSATQPRPQIRAAVMEVTAIDVGQGDSILVVSPEGKTLLIDAGGPVGGQQTEFDYGENVCRRTCGSEESRGSTWSRLHAGTRITLAACTRC